MLMRHQSLCQTLIDLGHVSFDDVYLLQIQLQYDTLSLAQLTTQCVGKLLFTGLQPTVSQLRQFNRVTEAAHQSLQHASTTLAQNVCANRREFDLRLFEQYLDLIPNPDD